jgi:O-methyltransferase involved in polyketide biosynthesis
LSSYAIIQTIGQWFDLAVQGAIASGIKQVVVVAAGFDTRAYRLRALPDGETISYFYLHSALKS